MGPRRIAVWLAAAGLAALPSPPAHAAAETLRRSVQNIALAPVDLVLSPATAARFLYLELQSAEDPAAARWVFAAPGWLWNTGMGAFGAGLRELAGLLELPPGLVLLPFEAELPVLFQPAEDGRALVDRHAAGFSIRFGVDYVSG